MKKMLVGLALVASTGFLTGCASVGEQVRIPVTMPNGERATIVAHNQSVPDWMLSRDSLRLNYIVPGEVTKEQIAAVAEAERACRLYTDTVRPSNLVAVLANGILYGLAGGLGVGIGSQAFNFARFNEYFQYGGTASGFGGAANGIISLGGQTYTFEDCGGNVLSTMRGYKEIRTLRKSPY